MSNNLAKIMQSRKIGPVMGDYSPNEEIEITPAMVEAGVANLISFDARDGLPNAEGVVKGLFLAMLSVSGARLIPIWRKDGY